MKLAQRLKLMLLVAVLGASLVGSGIQMTGVAQGPLMDYFILVDLSGSYRDDLPYFKEQVPRMIDQLVSANPNIWFGLGRFEDYPIDPFGDSEAGDKAYELIIDLTDDVSRIKEAIEGLSTRSGADDPQSQLAALSQAATGEGQDVNGDGDYDDVADIPLGQGASFRPSALRTVAIYTDASFHRPGDPGDIPYPGPSFEEAISVLRARGIATPGFASSPESVLEDLRRIAEGTGTFAPYDVDCDGDGDIDIKEGEPYVCEISFERIGETIRTAVEVRPHIPIVPPEKAILSVKLETTGGFILPIMIDDEWYELWPWGQPVDIEKRLIEREFTPGEEVTMWYVDWISPFTIALECEPELQVISEEYVRRTPQLPNHWPEMEGKEIKFIIERYTTCTLKGEK